MPPSPPRGTIDQGSNATGTTASPDDGRRSSFLVVGVGASAGGLNAYSKLLEALPPQSGMAFVLIPHLSPNHESLMASLLSRRTSISVKEIEDGMVLRPDTIYVIPPDRNLQIKGDVLRLEPLAGLKEQRAAVVDIFFRSLAEELHELAAGILLSGTSSYGTHGLKAIKENGGLTIAQDPAEAEYDQMPRSAIAENVADYVLPIVEMPAALAAYRRFLSPDERQNPPAEDDGLAQVLTLLNTRTRYDFSCYRQQMLQRRIMRRAHLSRVEEIAQYIQLLRRDNAEVQRLFHDLLIGVSGFFRDREAFGYIRKHILPELIRRKADTTGHIRIWIAGCASGEEAYSLAMLLHEAMAEMRSFPHFRIFATDVNEEALKTARQGLYPESITADVSAERLQRFFVYEDSHYRVNKQLRESVMFAAQNAITDAPFSKVDLVSCRNLLIYLKPEIQRRVIPLLHFSLNDGGYLFLGSSESVAKKWRVFKRIGPTRADRLEFPLGISNTHLLGEGAGYEARPASSPKRVTDLAQHLLLRRYAPAAVLINRKYELLYLHGPTGNYLDLPDGEPTHDLLSMAQEPLAARIRALCRRNGGEERKDASSIAHIVRGGVLRQVKVTVSHLTEPKSLEGLLLVTFEDYDPEGGDAPAAPPVSADELSMVQQMEYELKATREDLQSTIEDLESSNEELKSSNEEMISINEELQSVNEELETSKEELHSLNEELNTVNNQLQEKVEELDKANNDIVNLLNSTEIATIFLDTDLRIRRYIPATVYKFLQLIPADVGRSIADFAYKFIDGQLTTDARAVLERLTPMEKPVWTNDGLCYLRRILPYRTLENRIEGVVITFVDITRQIQADRMSQQLATLLKDSNDAITMHEINGRITAWNRGAENMYGYSETEAKHMSILDLAPPTQAETARAFLNSIAEGKRVASFETQRIAKDGRLLDVWLTATQLTDDSGKVIAVATTERDITARKYMERELLALNKNLEQRVAERTAEAQRRADELRRREEYLSGIVNTAVFAIITFDRDGIVRGFNPAAERMFGYTAADAVGTSIERLMMHAGGEDHLGVVTRWLRRTERGEGYVAREFQGRQRDGKLFPVDATISDIEHLGLYLEIVRDLSQRKDLESQIVEISTREQERIGREIHDGIGQQLTALTMIATTLQRRVKGHGLDDAFNELIHQLKDANREAHAMSQGLSPIPLEKGGLEAALRELARVISEHTGVPCDFHGKVQLSDRDNTVSLHLYRIAQEAINNAVRHAAPSRIRVDLSRSKGRLRLSIKDDGKGLNPAKPDYRRLGMYTMQYRANIIGATLEIRSKPGQGCTIVCTVPTTAGG